MLIFPDQKTVILNFQEGFQMPKKIKLIQVYACRGDQHGDTSTYTFFDKSGESLNAWNQEGKKSLLDAGFTKGVQPSDFDAVTTKLKTYIEAGDAAKMQALLTANFFYSKALDSVYTDNDHSRGDWNESGHEACLARPIIEALFFDKSAAFLALIDLLIAANNESLFKAFTQSLAGTDLSASMLFSWDKTMEVKAVQQVSEIRTYSSILANKANDEVALLKSRLMSNIAQQMLNRIDKKIVADEKEDLTEKTKFETLKFKLNTASILHSGDEALSSHRGYKRCVTNFFSILFTAGIANLVNRCATGQWMFFNKTTADKKVTQAQVALGLDLREKINFQKI